MANICWTQISFSGSVLNANNISTFVANSATVSSTIAKSMSVETVSSSTMYRLVKSWSVPSFFKSSRMASMFSPWMIRFGLEFLHGQRNYLFFPEFLLPKF